MTDRPGQTADGAEPLRIFWNRNLKDRISPGKLAAHAAHAALHAYGIEYDHPIVVLAAGKQRIETMPVHIRDEGRTELEPGTLTTGVEHEWGDIREHLAQIQHWQNAATTIEREVHDILAEGLGYPEYPPGSPGYSTGRTNYITGDHVSQSLAAEAARTIKELRTELEKHQAAVEAVRAQHTIDEYSGGSAEYSDGAICRGCGYELAADDTCCPTVQKLDAHLGRPSAAAAQPQAPEQPPTDGDSR